MQDRFSRSTQFWTLLVYLTFVFLVGGGARSDIESLLILRPAAVLVCAFALFTITREQLSQNRAILSLMAAWFLLIGLHLVPLPPEIWRAFPGRELIAEIDATAGLGDVWRPISLAPLATWNSFYALFVPLAAILLAIQLSRQERYQLLPIIIGLGFASGMLGLLQSVGGDQGPLYFYQITNYGSAVGLFANRNHQAILLACLFPMLAVYASAEVSSLEKVRIRTSVAAAAGLVIIPLLLVTGSRAGLILGVVGLLSVPLLYRRPRVDVPAKRRTRSIVGPVFAAGIVVVGLALLTILFARAEALTRIATSEAASEMRFSIWGPIADMAVKYFPVGSGVGAFVDVYKVDEPDHLLGYAYINHAHNDWLEFFMAGGIVAALLLFTMLVGWLVLSVRAWRRGLESERETRYAKLGSILVLMLGIASIADYPLRVPSLACLAFIFALWLRGSTAERSPDAPDRSAKIAGT